MDAPYYNAAPGERASDPEWERRAPRMQAQCRTCRATSTEEWHGTTYYGWLCDSCWWIQTETHSNG